VNYLGLLILNYDCHYEIQYDCHYDDAKFLKLIKLRIKVNYSNQIIIRNNVLPLE